MPDQPIAEDRLRARIEAETRANAAKRGCTCGAAAEILIAPAGPEERADLRIGILHAKRCPLYSSRSLSALAQEAEVDARLRFRIDMDEL